MAEVGVKKLYPLGETDWTVPPGETLLELLEERGMSQRDLARRTGLSPKHVKKLLHGLVPLSADVAVRLERVTGVPADFWNRREADYRSDLERFRSKSLFGNLMLKTPAGPRICWPSCAPRGLVI